MSPPPSRESAPGWLSLALLAALALGLLLLLLGAVEDLVGSDALVEVDARLEALAASFRTPAGTGFWLKVTALGSWPTAILLAASLALLAWREGRWASIPLLGLALAGVESAALAGKLALHRSRPPLPAYLEESFSFPSHHAALAVILAGFALSLAWGRLSRPWARAAGVLLAAAAALGVAFSRIYLGVQFASDAWGGLLLGALLLTAGMAGVRGREGRSPPAPSLPLSRRGRRVTGWAVVAGLLLAAAAVLRFSPPLLPLRSQPLSPAPGEVLALFRQGLLPPRTETLTARPQEPVGLILLAPGDESLLAAFRRAGWFLAERPTPLGLVSLAGKAWLNRSDPRAPMTPSFWHGGPHDFGFERPVPGQGIRERHHARFWRTPFRTEAGDRIFVGTASLDTGLKWGITHRIAPGIDAERDLLASDLAAAGAVRSARVETLLGPTTGTNFTGDPFFTDGRVVVLELAGEGGK